MRDLIFIEEIDEELRVDSRLISDELDIDHQSIIKAIKKFQNRIEKYGKVGFKIVPSRKTNSCQNETICYLNERQSTFLVTLSRNSEKAVELKQKLTDSYYFYKSQHVDQTAIPQTFSEALQLAADQAKQLEEAKPKIEFFDHVESSVNSISVVEFANILTKNGFKIGQNKLFKWFYENKYLISNSRPYQASLDNGWFDVKKINYEDGKGRGRTTHKILITGKGQTYFTNKIKKSWKEN